MTRFGKAMLVGLDHTPEAGIKPYSAQVLEGIRRDTPLGRLRHMAFYNYAYNYIFWLRAKSNDPARLRKLGRIERILRAPLARIGRTPRAAEFHDIDLHFAEKMLEPALVDRMAASMFAPQTFTDPYLPGFEHRGAPEATDHPFLYMDAQRLFEDPAFLEICSNPDLIAFCRESLGPRAALSWAWAWISQPTGFAYQNQNWHRDCAEPLNFIRVFVPLSPIATREDGPLEMIPKTSGLRDFCEVRRFRDEDLEPLKQAMGAGVVLADKGDVYFVNTFALHRGTPPAHRRGMLSLLVSIGPSHRTPSIRKLKLREVPEHLRPLIRKNRSFFRHLVG
ncbi:hypothetical protein [uncultured Sphingomonas sp.]|uniref:hypothetical protein n=1 Tax=uncultured Sphingomonas sp. TaxID=158754 RepID=UPI0025FF557F|nr:hypothetical protein [uncultured Sphingomonas sp.]